MILVNRLNKLEVFYHERSVGTMALYQNRLAAFEYDKDILAVAKKDYTIYRYDLRPEECNYF